MQKTSYELRISDWSSYVCSSDLVFCAMSRDGLMPAFFARLHPRYCTPWAGTIALAAGMGIAAAFLPITLLGDLVSLGTAVSFAIICFTVIWLRNTHPEMDRPFRVPLGGLDRKSTRLNSSH